MAFYAENLKHISFNDGVERMRVPFFYIHGKLEDEAGYDRCNATINELRKVGSIGWHITDVVMLDGRKEKVIAFKKFKLDSVEALIVSLHDTIEHIEQCLTNVRLDFYCESDRIELEKLRPELLTLFKNWNNDR